MVKVVRCDNAGENKTFEELSKQGGMGITFEYTAPGTPQQNGKCERKFASLYGKVRSMLNGVRFTKTLRQGLWTECAAAATLEDNILATATNPVPPYTQFHGKDAPMARNLRTFGEIGIVANVQKKIKNKLEDRGTALILIGYSPQHEIDVFRFLNPVSKTIRHSRDVQWLDKSYGDWKGLKTNVTHIEPVADDEDDDDPQFGREDQDAEEIEVPPPTPPRTRGKRVDFVPRQTDSLLNLPEAPEVQEK